MDIISVAEVTITGAHTVVGHPRCGERHGHTWRVRVEIASPEKDLAGGTLSSVIEDIRSYHRRDFDRFLPGVETTTAGLAAFFREILSDFPITAIEVMTDEGQGTRVTWQVR